MLQSIALSFSVSRKSDQVGSDSVEGGNLMGSPSRLDPFPIPSRCQAGSRTREFGFEFGFGTLSSGAATLPRTKNP
jgi:hypothetical protein